MKKLLWLLLIPTVLFADSTDGWHSFSQFDGWHRLQTGVVYVPVLAGQPLVGSFPFTSYDSSYARIRATQYFKAIHFDVLETQFENNYLYFVTDSTVGACVYYAQISQFTTAFNLSRTAGGILQLNMRGNIRNGDTTLFLGLCYRLITLVDDTLRFYRSTTFATLLDSQKVFYANVVPDTMTALTNKALTIGSNRQEVADGLNNVILNGGTSNFNLYDMLWIVDGDTLPSGNFNNGVIHRPIWNIVRWAGGKQHDFLTREWSDGYNSGNDAKNNYAVTRILRSRADTCYYFPLPFTNTRGGGVTFWTPNGEQRHTINDIEPSADGNFIYVIGTYNKEGTDSTATPDSSYHFAIWDCLNDEWIAPDSGLHKNAFPFHVEVANDTCVGISQLQGATRSLVFYNTVTFTNYKVDMDTSILAFTKINNSFYNVDGRRLIKTNIFTKVKTTAYTFNEAYLDAIQAVGRNGDTLWIGLGRHLYKFHNDILLATYTLDTFTAVDKFTIGGLQYDGIRDDGHGGVFIFGDMRGFNGIAGNILRISAYGSITSIATVGGYMGDEDAYEPSDKEGAFSITATGMLNLGGGQYLFVGAFRTVNGVEIGNNAFLWSAVTGARSLENNTTSFIPWEAVYYNGPTGYPRIAMCGDGRDWSGIMGNSLIGRYTNAEFNTLIPTPFVFTPPSDIDTTNYPPTITFAQYSPGSRQIIPVLTYQINSGVHKTTTGVKTDSSLTNIDGVWHYVWDITYNASDTVNPGDTVHCISFTSTDNFGNSRDTTFDDWYFNSLDPEVSAWVARVNAGGGTLTIAEINAVDACMLSIRADNLRDTICRWNPFVGDFVAAKHPVIFNFDGSETPIGSAIDTFVNWVSGDYNSRGLKDAANLTKYISTGVRPASISTWDATSMHISIYYGEYAFAGNQTWMGMIEGSNVLALANFGASDLFTYLNTATFSTVNPTGTADSGSYLSTRINGTQQSCIKNEVVIIDNAASNITAKPDWIIGIFASYQPAAVIQFFRARVRNYSFGKGFSQTQGQTLQAHFNTLQTTLGRNVY